MATVAVVAALGACGGRASRTDRGGPAAPSTPVGADSDAGDPSGPGASGRAGAGSNAPTGGAPNRPSNDGGAGLSEAEQGFQTVDDMSQTVGPAGSSAFIWSTPTASGLGNWFLSNSQGLLGDAPIDDFMPPREGTRRACHVTGPGYVGGIELWAQLNHPAGSPVDLSSFSGFSFWARSSSHSQELVVAIDDGRGYFFASATPSPLRSKTIQLSESWGLYGIGFEEVAADPSAVASIDFIAGTDGGPVDLWVNDLALSCRHELCR
ncbi:MAG TPA: hypothetical protein VEQ59_14930 [Polyangiaceae bacterium]|nr:hypothetical protein [Polyangiaceae bacterium]